MQAITGGAHSPEGPRSVGGRGGKGQSKHGAPAYGQEVSAGHVKKFATSESMTHPAVRPNVDTGSAAEKSRAKRRGSGMKMGS